MAGAEGLSAALVPCPRNVRVSEAPSFGLPAIQYDRHCPGSESYMNLAREILTRRAGHVDRMLEKEVLSHE